MFTMPSVAGVAACLLALTAGMACAETPFERGRYLVTSIMACGSCHSPRGPDAAGKPLSGGLTFDTPAFKVTAANITSDNATGIGRRTDDDIKRLLVRGERANGSLLAPIMPSAFYGVLTKDDLSGIVAYLRTVKPVRNEVTAPVYHRAVGRDVFPGAENPFTSRDLRAKLKRGFYLATIGHCMECHTPMSGGHGDFAASLGKGGREFKGPWGVVKSANLTSHRVAGIGAWTDAEIRRAITQGVRRDGRKLEGPMAFASYALLRKADLDALIAWLRTLPPKE